MFILVLTKKLKLNKFISGTKATKQHEGLATDIMKNYPLLDLKSVRTR
jgi:hypothetical protein